MADLAAAVASDAATCGLSAPDGAEMRASLSGFFRLPTGEMSGVAIITSSARADALSRAIAAATLARGVSKQIPVAVLGTHHVTGAHSRLNELASYFEAEDGVALGLLIINAELTHAELLAFQRQGRAVLAVCAEAPADAAGVVLEVGDGRLTASKTASGEPWAREFALDVVKVEGVEALVLKPGKAVSPAPVWKAAPPAVIAPVPPAPEIPITSRTVLFFERGEVPAAERAKWTGQGYAIARGQDDALPAPGQLVGERREIVVVGLGDHRPEDVESVANQLEQRAVARGVGRDVVIRVAA